MVMVYRVHELRCFAKGYVAVAKEAIGLSALNNVDRGCLSGLYTLLFVAFSGGI
jgi:hypothetical protein